MLRLSVMISITQFERPPRRHFLELHPRPRTQCHRNSCLQGRIHDTRVTSEHRRSQSDRQNSQSFRATGKTPLRAKRRGSRTLQGNYRSGREEAFRVLFGRVFPASLLRSAAFGNDRTDRTGRGAEMKPFRVECLNTTNGIAIASLLALPLLLASASLTFASSFQRLVDRVDSPPAARLIDGVWKRILPAKYGKLTFTVDPSIPRPRLHFHVGSDPGSEGGTVRFEISILPKGQAPTIVFQHDVRIHGWEEQEVDLLGTRPGGRADRTSQAPHRWTAEATLYQLLGRSGHPFSWFTFRAPDRSC